MAIVSHNRRKDVMISGKREGGRGRDEKAEAWVRWWGGQGSVTSSPPNWMRLVSLARSSSLNLAPFTYHTPGRATMERAEVRVNFMSPLGIPTQSPTILLKMVTWERRGRMVVPACPPTTVTLVLAGSVPWFSATKVLARITSSVVTPNSFLGLYVPAQTQARRGRVSLTRIAHCMLVLGGCVNGMGLCRRTGLLEHLGEDGHGRVDGVRDDEVRRVRGNLQRGTEKGGTHVRTIFEA